MKEHAALTTVIEIRDREGNKVGEKEVATYQGLLARAHEEGLRWIRTSIVQLPSAGNGHVAVVRALVRTRKGTYAGIGDATPKNVAPKVAPHFLRMAETRAKARALRDAVNIGVVALEELGDLYEGDPGSGTDRYPKGRPSNGHRRDGDVQNDVPPQIGRSAAAMGHEFTPMSDGQYRLLTRLASERGVPEGEVDSWMRFRFKVHTLAEVPVEAASRLIDQLKAGGDPLEGVAAA